MYSTHNTELKQLSETCTVYYYYRKVRTAKAQQWSNQTAPRHHISITNALGDAPGTRGRISAPFHDQNHRVGIQNSPRGAYKLQLTDDHRSAGETARKPEAGRVYSSPRSLTAAPNAISEAASNLVLPFPTSSCDSHKSTTASQSYSSVPPT